MPDQTAAELSVRSDPAARSVSAAKDDAVDAALAPDACILRHMARTSRAVVAAYDPALAPFGLTGHQFNLMTTLGNMGPLTVGALADALGMDASGVPRAIRPLADQDYITSHSGKDRRQRVLSLTPAGRGALDRATPAWRKVQEELIGALGAGRWMDLIPELRAVRRAATECSTRGRS